MRTMTTGRRTGIRLTIITGRTIRRGRRFTITTTSTTITGGPATRSTTGRTTATTITTTITTGTAEPGGGPHAAGRVLSAGALH